MKKSTTYILVAIVIILAIAIWGASRTKAPEKEIQIPVEGEVPVQEEIPAEGEIPAEIPAEPEVPETEQAPLGEFNPEAPVQTMPLAAEEIPEAVIRLEMSVSGITPPEFTVKPGENVSLVITSLDSTHVFKFEDPVLSKVAVGLAREETRGISFKAPAEKGDYVFYCDVPGHRARGESGVMHVR